MAHSKASPSKMKLFGITDDLIEELADLNFDPPVSHVYNPLVYARKAYDVYLSRYAALPKDIVLVGMNPGPWGMAQSGVPFGEIDAVKNWLQIETDIGIPREMHPKKPVTGFACTRSEVSGKRLWGWARKFFGTPDNFFKRFFVANYCPLLFLDSSGRNRTPPSLRMAARKPLLDVCDRALRRTITFLNPRYVIGVGYLCQGSRHGGFGRDGTYHWRHDPPQPGQPEGQSRLGRGHRKGTCRYRHYVQKCRTVNVYINAAPTSRRRGPVTGVWEERYR